jgi:hypothetical protein
MYGAWPLLVFVAWPLVKGGTDFGERRQEIASRLRDDGGRHLVVVRYGPRHNVNQEWVYNEADIDGAAIVWARELGPGSVGGLLEYFRGRRVWLLEADSPDPRPVPYPESGTDARPGAPCAVVPGDPVRGYPGSFPGKTSNSQRSDSQSPGEKSPIRPEIHRSQRI